VATWGYGIIYLEKMQKKAVYNPSNSSLQTIIPGDFCRVYGMAFDKNMNLWVTNSGVSNPISVLSADGKWTSLNYGPAINAPNVSKLLIDSGNRKWVILPRGNGLFVFDDNGTPGDIRDDTYTRVSIADNAGNEISNFVYDIAEDLEGNIWVGTASGPVVYYHPAAVFEGPQAGGYAQQILVPRNDGSGLGDYLLSTETITSIAVDGANRKWFGTRNSGVYLISADGLKQIHHFTRENSPLLSNTINSITIDGQTGEVFFATDKGIVSYRGTATSGGDSFGKVYVFPNPVRETYHGDITITGLARNVNVKITDISGNLVFETKALGGQAVWNGKNFDGRRVATGVYLVFCTNEDGSKTYVTKLLFIH
jgi:ligand-binding sensor domain-containing protein